MNFTSIRPRLRSACLATTILSVFSLLLLAGCSQPTPQERYAMADDKINNQRPPDYLSATNILKELIKLPKTAENEKVKSDSYFLLAEAYKRINDLERSVDYLKQGYEEFGKESEAGQALAEAYINGLLAVKKTEDSLELIQTLLAMDELPIPRRTRLRLREAAALNGIGKTEEAREKFWEMSQEFNEAPIEMIALENFVATYAVDNLTSAAEAYLRFAEAKPESDLTVQAKFGAAAYYLQDGNTDLADPLLDEYLKIEQEKIDNTLNPQEKLELQFGLGKALSLAQREEELLELYDQIFEENKDNEQVANQALGAAAMVHLDKLRFDEGLEKLALIQELFPGTESARFAAEISARATSYRLKLEQDAAAAENEAAQSEEASDGDAGEKQAADEAATEDAPESAVQDDEATTPTN